jgi:hypothetical protein
LRASRSPIAAARASGSTRWSSFQFRSPVTNVTPADSDHEPDEDALAENLIAAESPRFLSRHPRPDCRRGSQNFFERPDFFGRAASKRACCGGPPARANAGVRREGRRHWIGRTRAYWPNYGAAREVWRALSGCDSLEGWCVGRSPLAKWVYVASGMVCRRGGSRPVAQERPDG